MKRAITARGALLLVAMALVMLMAAPVAASGQSASPSPGSEPQVVGLTVVSGPNGKVSPENVIYGNCGYAWMYLFNNFVGDEMGTADYGAHSSKGAIVHVSFMWYLQKGGKWLNSWSGNEWPWSPDWTKWQDIDISSWGAGTYTATLSTLDVWTDEGYHCTGLVPWDREWID